LTTSKKLHINSDIFGLNLISTSLHLNTNLFVTLSIFLKHSCHMCITASYSLSSSVCITNQLVILWLFQTTLLQSLNTHLVSCSTCIAFS